MNENKPAKSLWQPYVKDRRKILAFAAVCSLIMGSIYGLYAVSWEPFLYGMAFCLTAGAGMLAADYQNYCRRHRYFLRMQQETEKEFYEFPRPYNLESADYRNFLERVCREKEDFRLTMSRKQQETYDYFILWMHQVKTPIAAMRLTLQEQDTDTNRELQAELFKIDQYVEMALTYLKLGNSASDYVFQKLSLDHVVRKAVRNYASLFVLKKIKLDLQELNCDVVSDEKWLVFVIGQLLSNGLKYTNQGSISIYMQEEKVLVIEDTGIGILPEDLPRIWEKGFTGYNGRKQVHSTGIGLYLCRRILKELSHTIAVESQVGRGTKLKIDFEKRTEITVDK